MRKGSMAIAAFWPVIYIAGFIGMFAVAASQPEVMHQVFPVFFVLHAFTMLQILVTMGWFTVDVLQDTRLDSTQRLLWALLLVTGGPIAFPVYYWIQVRPRGGWTELA